MPGSIASLKTIRGQISTVQSISGSLKETFLHGLSAYELAVKEGFEGTLEEWLSSLVGYSVTVEVVTDTADEYVLDIHTKDEVIRTPNLKSTPVKGVDYFTNDDINEIKTNVYNDLGVHIKPITNSEIESIFSI